MNTLEILVAAKSKIVEPKHWTRGTFSRDEFGETINVTSNDAVCWCSLGALDAITLLHNTEAAEYILADRLLADAVKFFGGGSVASYNDSNTHEAVMQVWDKAIELAKEK